MNRLATIGFLTGFLLSLLLLMGCESKKRLIEGGEMTESREINNCQRYEDAGLECPDIIFFQGERP